MIENGREGLSTCDGKRFDVAVVGGGINGTATAATLSAAGYAVLLVEQRDFGSGSSSRSTRLLHCGLNYLAMAADAASLTDKLRNLRLARDMMKERARLFSQLNGRLRPTRFFIPIRAGDAVKPWQYDVAFAMLRGLGGGRLPLNYERIRGRRLRDHILGRSFGDDLVSLVAFDELVFVSPERVCVDHALAAASNGAVVLNYTTVRGATKRGSAWELSLCDTETGEREARVEARAVVNMAGVWSNDLNAFNPGVAARTVTPNKGCHMACRLPPAFNGIGFMSRNHLGHMFVCVPWRDFHIIGPTETIFDQPPGPCRPGAPDVATILSQAKVVCPGAAIDQEDILFTWAGLRPATAEPGNPRGGWRRRIYTDDGQDGSLWLSMSWGRLADHAITARDVLEQVGGRFGQDRPGRDRPGQDRLGRDRLGREAGAGASTMAAFSLSQEHDLGRIIATEAPSSVADVMFGRTGWGWDEDLGASRVAQVSSALADARRGKTADAHAGEYQAYLEAVFGNVTPVAGMSRTPIPPRRDPAAAHAPAT